MTIPEEGFLLRIFIESGRHGHYPLYEAIVLKAREQGMAGATMLRGVRGFGKHSVLHTANILRLSEDLPMVIEIVDSREKKEGSTSVGRNDHGRIGDVGTNKSSSVQGLIAFS